METQVVCPNCRAENLPGAMNCYKCNSKMPTAPAWAGPASFKVYDATKDRGVAYMAGVAGAVLVVVSYFLAWLGVPKGGEDVENRGTSALDILLGSNGSKGSIGRGGVGEGSVGLDVRFILLVVLLVALAAIAIFLIKPVFAVLLPCGLIVLAGTLYFLVQLVVRNTATFNTPDLVGLLRLGFYGSVIGGAVIIGAAMRYRKVPTLMSRTN